LEEPEAGTSAKQRGQVSAKESGLRQHSAPWAALDVALARVGRRHAEDARVLEEWDRTALGIASAARSGSAYGAVLLAEGDAAPADGLIRSELAKVDPFYEADDAPFRKAVKERARALLEGTPPLRKR
jgi:hypothetical protein